MTEKEKWGLLMVIYFISAAFAHEDNFILFVICVVLAGVGNSLFVYGGNKKEE